MKLDTDLNVNKQEIDDLESNLKYFQEQWQQTQAIRSTKWRRNFVCSFIVAIAISMLIPKLWWIGIAVITYFAGSLFTLLRQNAKTSVQIFEQKEQLELVKILKNLDPSSYSEK